VWENSANIAIYLENAIGPQFYYGTQIGSHSQSVRVGSHDLEYNLKGQHFLTDLMITLERFDIE